MAIKWYEASAEAISVSDAPFDVILCQMGLQFVADKDAALREMRRVPASGDRLILSVPGLAPRPLAIIGEALARHVGAEAAGFVHHVLLHNTAKLENLTRTAGFREVSAQSDVSSYASRRRRSFSGSMCLARPWPTMAQVDQERRASLERDVVENWQEFVKDGALMFRVRTVVTVARK